MTDIDRLDNDATLETLLRAGLPPARDPLFRIAVLERRERQRFRRQVATTITVGALTTALVAVSAAAIGPRLTDDVTLPAAMLAVAAAAVSTLPGGSRLVPSGLRNVVRAWFPI